MQLPPSGKIKKEKSRCFPHEQGFQTGDFPCATSGARICLQLFFFLFIFFCPAPSSGRTECAKLIGFNPIDMSC